LNDLLAYGEPHADAAVLLPSVESLKGQEDLVNVLIVKADSIDDKSPDV